MPGNHNEVEKRLWEAADELRANSKLKASDYSMPVLGLIFLRYADDKFAQAEKELAGKQTGRRTVGKTDYQARGVMYLPEDARFSKLAALPEGANIGKAINEAMRAIEDENDDLRDVLPKSYNRFENSLLIALIRNFASVPMDLEGDTFGKIYEYFLGKFAMSEGQKGGEFFTPTSIVKLIVEIIEPFHGRIFDPACGSGGMFVQSARFVQNHRGRPDSEIAVYGQERVLETVRLCRMNLAVHGLAGEIREGNSYYENIHKSTGRFDFVMANPPFNVDKIDKERLEGDPRFPFGLPKADNGNYLWIQLFASALNERGRAGFVMANSAGDARNSEQEIRRQMIEAGLVDVIVTVGPNMFYTVTLPCTLWFLDRGKIGTPRENKLLFVDARQLYRQIDRAHREFKSGCVEKSELQERFPAVVAIPGLLVESPIDGSCWDWVEEVATEEQFRSLAEPVIAMMERQAIGLAERLYADSTYASLTTSLVKQDKRIRAEAAAALYEQWCSRTRTGPMASRQLTCPPSG
jgi:type I restriction enzyme M protein